MRAEFLAGGLVSEQDARAKLSTLPCAGEPACMAPPLGLGRAGNGPAGKGGRWGSVKGRRAFRQRRR